MISLAMSMQHAAISLLVDVGALALLLLLLLLNCLSKPVACCCPQMDVKCHAWWCRNVRVLLCGW